MIERYLKWWIFPLMSTGVVSFIGLGYFLFLTPFEWCGLFFCYAVMGLSLGLCALTVAVTLILSACFVIERRFLMAAWAVTGYFCVYALAFFAVRFGLVLWVRAKTGC